MAAAAMAAGAEGAEVEAAERVVAERAAQVAVWDMWCDLASTRCTCPAATHR